MAEKKGTQNKKDESKKDESKKNENKIGVDFNLGTLSLGGIFQGIENVIDLVSKMEAVGVREGKHEEAFTSPSGNVNAVYGFSVKTSLGGQSIVEPFGNLRKTSRGPVVGEERQPLVDVFDEKDHILVIAELPGVAEEHISTEVKGDILTLSATNGERKYYKEVVLPEDVDADTLQRKYNNGVLEIKVSKKEA
ncbi:MAG TPA: archaeal heat shock protein Hsp20 [Ktedonobacteraceae bacterium]|jgi:HSP20 family protein